MSSGFGVNTLLIGFPIIFTVMFITIFSIIIFKGIRGITQWNKNNHSPLLTVPALIVSRRMDVSHHHHNSGNGVGMNTSSTSYYATFQVESGDRIELPMSGEEYAQLVEGDVGDLTFQGTRYKDFQRKKVK